MTVSELRKTLVGVNGKIEVHTRDHDHSEYETNGLASYAGVIDQRDMEDWERKDLDDIFLIKKKYFIVSV